MNDKAEYLKANRRKLLWIAVLAVIMGLIALYSISVTQHYISFHRALEIVWDHLHGVETTTYIDWVEDYIVCESLSPRALGGTSEPRDG